MFSFMFPSRLHFYPSHFIPSSDDFAASVKGHAGKIISLSSPSPNVAPLEGHKALALFSFSFFFMRGPVSPTIFTKNENKGSIFHQIPLRRFCFCSPVEGHAGKNMSLSSPVKKSMNCLLKKVQEELSQ